MGEHEFIVCKEGFAQVYVKGYFDDTNMVSKFGGYGIVYNIGHPL